MHYFSFAPVQINGREHTQEGASRQEAATQQEPGTQQQVEHGDVTSDYSELESDLDEEEAPSKRPRMSDNRIDSD